MIIFYVTMNVQYFERYIIYVTYYYNNDLICLWLTFYIACCSPLYVDIIYMVKSSNVNNTNISLKERAHSKDGS